MTYFRKRHFISHLKQISFFIFQLNSLIEEFEESIFYNPFKILDSDPFIQGFTPNEI